MGTRDALGVNETRANAVVMDMPHLNSSKWIVVRRTQAEKESTSLANRAASASAGPKTSARVGSRPRTRPGRRGETSAPMGVRGERQDARRN
mmetsp:Transcript_2957/g.11218  ORF Transcript_2957/g.11218 Transcript_2957/m.11218 type:complete len:92 (+) Transcript_2957:1627-1902(+)